ncbi:hypothetical protein C8R45DRAFT_150778 [Mycena sanguinolenta]|nr:hypothetical protein C8R45DRAFT_150778 [Mycena sanguinolenta]
MPVLPQELFDAIIDEAREDTKTLKSCAVVASSFRSHSQGHLFRHVVVGETDRGVSATFFTESPHLALYIYHLSIHLVYYFDAIALALRLAQNIEHLSVSGRGVKWEQLGDVIPLALFDCLARLPLRRLTLRVSMTVPAAFIRAALAAVPVVSFLDLRVDPNWRETE